MDWKLDALADDINHSCSIRDTEILVVNSVPSKLPVGIPAVVQRPSGKYLRQRQDLQILVTLGPRGSGGAINARSTTVFAAVNGCRAGRQYTTRSLTTEIRFVITIGGLRRRDD